MRDQYDFSNSVPNPYVKKLKKQITIRLDQDVIEYFKQLSDQNGVPYQNLINLYLKDCAQSHKELKLDWQQVKLTSCLNGQKTAGFACSSLILASYFIAAQQG